jgi:hypothetical protein
MVARTHSARRRSPRRPSRRRSRWRRWFASLGAKLATLVIGLIIAVVSFTMNYEQQIERRTAKAFLEKYYSLVVNAKTRDRAWIMLTPEFQRNHPVKSRKAYDGEWNKVKTVRVGPVHSVNGEKNHFLTRLTYVLRDGRIARPEKLSFELKCNGWMSKQPFVKCDVEHLRLHDAIRPDSLATLV